MIDLERLVPVFAVDWFTIIIFGVGIVIWLLNQLFGQEKEAPKPQRRRAAQAGGRPAGGAQADEIDRFLREIASRRKEGQGQAPEMEVLRPQAVEQRSPRQVPAQRRRQAAPPQRRTSSLRPAAESPTSNPMEKPRASLAEARDETTVADQVRELLSSDVAQHVQEHLGASTLEKDDALSAGSLSVGGGLGMWAQSIGTGIDKRKRGGSSASLAALLRSGVGLRQAVVLTEIFGPPRSRRPIR